MSDNGFEAFTRGKKTGGESSPSSIPDTNNPKKQKKDSVVLPKSSKNDNKNIVLLSAIGVLLVIVLGVLAWFFVFAPKGEHQVSNAGTEEITQSGPQSSAIVYEDDLGEAENEAIFPRPYQEWETVNEEFLEDGMLPLAKNATIDVFMSSTGLPTEDAGYTSDLEQLANEDGSLNTMFSTWTEESFFRQLAKTVEIFLNPVFGGWENLQYPDGSSVLLISDTEGYPFTENWLEAHSEDLAAVALPVFADKNADNYGLEGEIVEYGPRWIGDITTGSLEMNFDDETQNYAGEFNANVRFLSFTKDREDVLEKQGKLYLKLVTNEEGMVLVDNATLEVE